MWTSCGRWAPTCRWTARWPFLRAWSALTPAPLRAPDLRAGAALVVAALMADGTSEVEEIGYIERGYENIVEKLRALGADIQKVERMPAALEQAM